MGVPMGARSRLETHKARTHPRRCRRLDDRILPNYAGERLCRAAARRRRAARTNFHDVSPSTGPPANLRLEMREAPGRGVGKINEILLRYPALSCPGHIDGVGSADRVFCSPKGYWGG